MQFDMGRGTTLRLQELGIHPRPPPVRTAANTLDAIFFTHMHTDHCDDLSIYLQGRWHWFGADIDIICSDDVEVPVSATVNRTISCRKYVENIGAAFIASGEIDQRLSEGARRPGGPSTLANLTTFDPTLGDDTIVEIWTKGAVNVKVITSPHIGGHASYRVNTPAGSVVIGGDASNVNPDPSTRPYSTSDQVELLAQNADILVHSTVHPVFGPGGQSTYNPLFYNRQSNAVDLGAMAQRANVKRVMPTHLIPSIGADLVAATPVPGGPLTAQDYCDAIQQGGFEGLINVGSDLTSVRLCTNKV